MSATALTRTATVVPPPVSAPRRTLPAGATQPKTRLIFDLLHGVAGPEEWVIQQGRALGMDLTQPRAVVLVDASDYALAPVPDDAPADAVVGARARTRQVIRAIASFFMLPHETICADLGDGMIAVLKASNSRNLDEWARDPGGDALASPSWANLAALKRAANDLLERLIALTGEAVSIGIGRYHPGIAGLASSFVDARAALTLGRRLSGPNRVHCLDELGIGAFVGLEDERTKIGLAHHLLSPLDHEPILLETLDAFFATDCSPALAAQRLGIHRNTLTYRLAEIASLTGLDPRRFDDAVQIRLARVLRGLESRPLPPALASPALRDARGR